MTEPTHPYGGNGISVATGAEAKENWDYIVKRWPDLRARLHPLQDGSHDKIHTAPASHPPIDLTISDLMFEITERARWYGDELLREEQWEPRTSSMPGLLEEVAERFGHWISLKGDEGRQRGLEYCDWAHDYRHRVEQALEKPAPRQYIGPCWHCDGDMYVKRGQQAVQCPWCGTMADMDERMEWVIKQLQSRRMTREEIHDSLHFIGLKTTRAAIRKWIHRGQLPEGKDELFSLTDALPLAERQHGRPPLDKQKRNA